MALKIAYFGGPDEGGNRVTYVTHLSRVHQARGLAPPLKSADLS
jgi:hypothetical protein